MINILFGCIFMAMVVYVLYVYTERSYPSFFNSACQSANPALMLGIKTFKSNVIAVFVLVLTMNKLSAHIPALASKFGGDGSSGALSKQFENLKNLGKNVSKTVVKGAIAAPGAIKNAASKIKKIAKGK